ncbi:hypothetical protein [Dialister invisus]|uniref:hypothetical protein n=1 Tax=Dialister invisus TaxID=218538 RepID=UPI0028E27285|nr:hypothetical protein [Dialister invisus]
MTIDKYFEKSRFRDRIKKGGINLLLKGWESRVNRIPFDPHYLFDEWTNDLYGRAEIQKIFLACEIPEEIRQRLEAIDEIYRQKTIPLSDIGVTNFCLEQDWDKENYWFAYRIPPERWEDWKEYYKDPIYFYEKEE